MQKKMIFKFLLLDPYFTKKMCLQILKYASILHIIIIGLYCKFRLVQLYRVSANPVRYRYVIGSDKTWLQHKALLGDKAVYCVLDNGMQCLL